MLVLDNYHLYLIFQIANVYTW